MRSLPLFPQLKKPGAGIVPSHCLICLIGSGIMAFGLYNIHAQSAIAEGGVPGLTLLLQYLTGLSPALTGLILNALCMLLGWRTLGRDFLVYSLFGTGGFSLFYYIFEQFPPLWPQIYSHPLLAAVCGGILVGVGAGLSVRMGGATGGEDASAMALSRLTGLPIQWVFLLQDAVVLSLSLLYIPWQRLLYSLLSVFISGQLVGLLQRHPAFRLHWQPRD